MNWEWANALDQIWRTPALPTWLILAAAGFFGVIGIVTLSRAEKSVANVALAVITLLAIGVATAATTRGFRPGNPTKNNGAALPGIAAAPALSCIDDLAGEVVLAACEKALFGSPESTAAALSYAARQITRLTGFGDVSAASKDMTGELEALRHAVEHDRFGLMAEVLVVRDHCTPSDCAAFQFLTDRQRILVNMGERTYDGLIARYSPVWNTSTTPATAPVAALVPGVPTGRPTNAEFPSAASTPAVSIMTTEPGTGTTSTASTSRPAAPSSAPAPRPTASPALAATKKPPAPKPARPPAPVSIAPATTTPAAADE
jgi:hypothetical protein